MCGEVVVLGYCAAAPAQATGHRSHVVHQASGCGCRADAMCPAVLPLLLPVQAAQTRRYGRTTRQVLVSTAATAFLMAWPRTNAWLLMSSHPPPSQRCGPGKGGGIGREGGLEGLVWDHFVMAVPKLSSSNFEFCVASQMLTAASFGVAMRKVSRRLSSTEDLHPHCWWCCCWCFVPLAAGP
jgi:hypothetical protein